MECSQRLIRKLRQTLRAFNRLKEIKNYEGYLEREILYEVAAKRFEYTFESLWKLLRLYLLDLKGLECNSPMDCFKTFYQLGVLGEEEGRLIPKVVRKRNEIVHIYDFLLAEDIYRFILSEVIPLFEKILKVVEKDCENLEGSGEN